MASASASGSQTDGHSGADEESSSDEIEGDFVTVFAEGGRSPAFTIKGSAMVVGTRSFAGDAGRGEHVLVDRKSLAPRDSSQEKRLSWDGIRSGQWSSTLFDGPTKAVTKRRSSPSLPLRKVQRRPLMDIPRPPTPPLTFDSIQPTYNPFALFHIRWELLAEVVLLDSALVFALYRLHSMRPSSLYPSLTPLPIASLSMLAFLLPFISLFRRPTSYFKVPFTDERGYRDPKAADDGIATALVLPVLLASACLWDTYSTLSPAVAIGFDNIAPLVKVWTSSGLLPVPQTPASALLGTPLASARALLQARHELVLLTALNAAVLVGQLILSKTFLRIDRLPSSNTKRFFGSMTMSGMVSLGIYLTCAAWDWGVKGA
ncbi:hypothetical protein P7C70_g4560, partial [Phenoliferia sp. Uapishka_3]